MVLTFSAVYVLNKKKYQFEALIVGQVGEGYAIFKDKFRVIPLEDDGFYALEFYHQRDVAMTSPAYNLWTFFSRKEDNTTVLGEDVAKYTSKDIKRMFKRGCVFKKTSEGNLHPVMITEEGDLKVLSQDDRAYAVTRAKKRAERNRTAWDKYAPVIMLVSTVVVCACIFIFSVVYFNITMAENIANVCSGVPTSGVAIGDFSVVAGG